MIDTMGKLLKSVELVQYGGAIYSTRCMFCGSKCKAPSCASVNKFMKQHGNKAPHVLQSATPCPTCRKTVDLPFVGFDQALKRKKGK